MDEKQKSPGNGPNNFANETESLPTDVLKVIEEMPIEYREVLALYEDIEMDLDEIAAITGKDIEIVKTQIVLARKWIRRTLPHYFTALSLDESKVSQIKMGDLSLPSDPEIKRLMKKDIVAPSADFEGRIKKNIIPSVNTVSSGKNFFSFLSKLFQKNWSEVFFNPNRFVLAAALLIITIGFGITLYRLVPSNNNEFISKGITTPIPTPGSTAGESITRSSNNELRQQLLAIRVILLNIEGKDAQLETLASNISNQLSVHGELRVIQNPEMPYDAKLIITIEKGRATIKLQNNFGASLWEATQEINKENLNDVSRQFSETLLKKLNGE